MSNVLALDDWKKFVKKQKDAKDVGSIEGWLKEYSQQQQEEDLKAQVETLAALAKGAKDAAKKNAKNTEVADYLDEISKEAEKQGKKLAAQAAKAEDESEEDEEEEEDNAALGVMFTKVKKRKPEKALNFALAVGKPSGIVITKKALSATHTKAAKEMRQGQGAIWEGRCFGDGKACIFELTEPPPRGLAKKIKAAALAHADMKIKVKVRGGGVELDDETDIDDEEQGAIPESPPQPSAETSPQPSAETTAETPPEFPPPPVQTPPVSPPSPTTSSDAAQLLADLNDLMPKIKAAVEKDPSRKDLLVRAAGAAKKFIDGNQLDQARPILKELADQLADGGSANVGDKERQQFLTDWLSGVVPNLKVLADANSPDLDPIKQLLARFKTAAQARDWDTATGVYEEVDKLLTPALRKARQSEAEQVIPEGAAQIGLSTEQIDKVATAWEETVMAALDGVATLRDEVAESEYAEVRPIAEFLDEFLTGFPTAMNATLELLRTAARNGDARGVKQGQSRAKKNVAECVAYLKANANLIAACEEHPFEVNAVSVSGPLKSALTEVSQLLKA